MRVKDLISELLEFDQNQEVFVYAPEPGDENYSPGNNVHIKQICRHGKYKVVIEVE